jgi:hypothetical protein
MNVLFPGYLSPDLSPDLFRGVIKNLFISIPIKHGTNSRGRLLWSSTVSRPVPETLECYLRRDDIPYKRCHPFSTSQINDYFCRMNIFLSMIKGA